jgi:hypothetical protein
LQLQFERITGLFFRTNLESGMVLRGYSLWIIERKPSIFAIFFNLTGLGRSIFVMNMLLYDIGRVVNSSRNDFSGVTFHQSDFDVNCHCVIGIPNLARAVPTTDADLSPFLPSSPASCPTHYYPWNAPYYISLPCIPVSCTTLTPKTTIAGN